jgi:glucose 1-dehydrogenase
MSQKVFEQEVAIVTGAGQGIGFEICCRLAEEGASIVLNDLDEALAAKATAYINEQYGTCCQDVPGNAADPAVIARMLNTAVQQFGKLSIAIANAGITVFGDFLSYTPEALKEVLDTNISGSFFLVQAAAKQMVQQNSGGSILLMSSVTAHQAHKNLSAYGMTKAGLEMLAKGLVAELSEHRIRVNTIAPGATMTERTAKEKNYEADWSVLTPLGRPAYPSDIADAALFLVSAKARHITGQSLVIDGGWSAISPSPYER